MAKANYQYGWVSIALHWVVAGLVVWLYLSGEEIEHFTGERADKLPLVLLHNSIGVLLIVTALLRTFVRVTKGMPEKPKQFFLFDWLAVLVPWGLIASILVIIVTGVLTWWTVSQPLAFFDLFSIPSPFAERNMELHGLMEEIHEIAAHVIVVLVGLHVLGALKHLIIDRDGLFFRILRPAK